MKTSKSFLSLPSVALWTLLTGAAASLVACDGLEPEPGGPSDSGAQAATPPHSAVPKEAAAELPAPAPPREESRRVAPSAKKTFAEVTALIRTHYVDGALTEDELWTAATEGVLARLIQREHYRVNKLLSPEELDRLLEGTRGHIVGIGVAIEEVAGTLVVRELIPGGPAAGSGLEPGDRILGVDGQRLRGMSLRDAVTLIRGEAGSAAELFVQRDTEEWTLSIPRGQVAVPSVASRSLETGIGYLRLSGFTKSTSEEVGKHLEALGDAGMERLVLDLRACPGGLLDSALDVAEFFLEPGKSIVSIRGVDGSDDRTATRVDGWENVPMVVLIGPKTASGAEIVAGALQEHGRSLVVGQPSFGKGTVEAIHDLSNGWAVKLTSARFFSPNDTPRQDNGVRPDIEVAGNDVALARVEDLSASHDIALHAAIELLSR